MAVKTGKLTWRSNTPNKSDTGLLTLLRDFVVGNGWTVVYDNIGSGLYFVVTYNRATGFAKDNPIVQVTAGGSVLTLTAYESWSGTAGTNPANTPVTTPYSTTDDTDLYISCAPEFILVASGVATTIGGAVGVVCFERLAGDSDAGAFYGHFSAATMDSTRILRVPSLWNGTTGASATFNVTTKLGQTHNGGLAMTDEAGRHVVFDLHAARADYGKLKGQLYGVATSTYVRGELTAGTFLPSAAAPEWLVTRGTTDLLITTLMKVASPIVAL